MFNGVVSLLFSLIKLACDSKIYYIDPLVYFVAHFACAK
jgi:hypothetical protein